jgi:hypothetical protein
MMKSQQTLRACHDDIESACAGMSERTTTNTLDRKSLLARIIAAWRESHRRKVDDLIRRASKFSHFS